MGSGKHLRRAIKKYGLDNFSKEILFTFDTEDDMNAKEKELVTGDFCERVDTYNICEGGKGGFGYINNKDDQSWKSFQNKIPGSTAGGKKVVKEKIGIHNPKYDEVRKLWSKRSKGFSDRKHTQETKDKISLMCSIKQTGELNSQYGTMWITNGSINKKIKKNESLPDGFRCGRLTKN